MTTVATDGKSMFSDSQQTGSYIDRVGVLKVYKVNGSLWGVCGSVAQWLVFLKWLDGGDKPTDLDDFEALQVNDKGKVFNWQRTLQPVEVGTPAAIGSGRECAMGAMLAGASPRKAVAIACELDSYSGGKVRGLRL